MGAAHDSAVEGQEIQIVASTGSQGNASFKYLLPYLQDEALLRKRHRRVEKPPRMGSAPENSALRKVMAIKTTARHSNSDDRWMDGYRFVVTSTQKRLTTKLPNRSRLHVLAT